MSGVATSKTERTFSERFFRPPRSFSSIKNRHPATLAPASFTNETAAFAVPPVASKSSTIKWHCCCRYHKLREVLSFCWTLLELTNLRSSSFREFSSPRLHPSTTFSPPRRLVPFALW